MSAFQMFIEILKTLPGVGILYFFTAIFSFPTEEAKSLLSFVNFEEYCFSRDSSVDILTEYPPSS